MAPRTVHFVSLGCAKSRVDTEVMLGVSDDAGFQVVEDPAAADVIVVNTCGFIGPAKEESIETILEMARYKESGSEASIRKVVVEDDKLAVTAGKAGFCYTLDEERQERIGVRLELGSGVAWCGDVPAKSQGTPPSTTKNDEIDYFRGTPDAPAPAVCPMVPRGG